MPAAGYHSEVPEDENEQGGRCDGAEIRSETAVLWEECGGRSIRMMSCKPQL